MLGPANAEYIIHEISNDDGYAWFAAVVDFATPIDGHGLPAGNDQLVATLVVNALPGAAAPQFSPVPFQDGVDMPPKYNVVSRDGGQAVQPVLVVGGVNLLLAFIRGDANRDGLLDISDVILVLNYLFILGPVPPCEDSADSNNDGNIDLADTIWVLNYLFVGGPAPSLPFPLPGVDPDEDDLGCDA